VRVLGVDPGLTRCGVGIVEGQPGRQLQMVYVDVIRSGPAEPIERRLLGIDRALDAWITAYRPDVVAVERVFSQSNVRTVMQTAQASGVALVVAARHGLPVALHTPSEVKAAVTGSGQADKVQITTMVTKILRLDVRPTPADAADALALAICQVWRGSAQRRLADAVARQTGRAAS